MFDVEIERKKMNDTTPSRPGRRAARLADLFSFVLDVIMGLACFYAAFLIASETWKLRSRGVEIGYDWKIFTALLLPGIAAFGRATWKFRIW